MPTRVQFTSLIPTTLSAPAATPMSPATRRAIITGSAIGGTVFVIIIVALVIFCKRSNRLRLNYKKLRVFGHRKQRTMLLDDDEDYDLADPPGMQRLSERYSDNPYPPSIGSRMSANSQTLGPTFPIAAGPGTTSPHVLGLRASESGSIFREAVWPPPGEASRFVDPLLAGSSSVDLSRIVGDVMGSQDPRNHAVFASSASQSSFQPSIAIASGSGSGTHSRQTSSSRLLGSSDTSYAIHPGQDPPEYDYDEAERARELELARAQSPDSQVYTSWPGPLRIANAGPDSPLSPSYPAHATGTPPGTPKTKTKNWLERSPKTTRKESTDDAPAATTAGPSVDQVVMGEAL